MYISSVYKAWACLGLDEKDQAFQHLEKAYLERDPWMFTLNVFQGYDSLRSDPRFKALQKKMNFE
jgi:hypothetical protein